MEEKLTKIIEVAEVKETTETAEVVADAAPQPFDIFEAVKTAVLPGSARAWTDEKLIQFADFIVSCGSMSYANISRGLDKEDRYVSNVLYTQPKLKELLKDRRQAWFEEQMSLAQSVYQEAMVSPDVPWTNKLAAAKDVMSKAGYDAVNKVENTNKELVVELKLGDE